MTRIGGTTNASQGPREIDAGYPPTKKDKAVTLRKIAERLKVAPGECYRGKIVAFLLDAVVTKEITIHGLLCNISKCDHKAAALHELGLEDVWEVKEKP